MADTPFGLSFGQPSKYMGQSPLAEIGKAGKTALTAYAMQKSGLTGWLNNLGKNPEQTVVQGAVPLPSSFNQYLAQPGPQMGVPPAGPMGGEIAPTAAPQIQMAPPPDIGNKILEGDDSWQESSVNPQASRDTQVLPPQTGYNQMLATGNEYQQVPGYGKLQNFASKMFG